MKRSTNTIRRNRKLANFRIRIISSADRFAVCMIEHVNVMKVWCPHATMHGMTLTDVREFAKLTGLALLEEKRK